MMLCGASDQCVTGRMYKMSGSYGIKIVIKLKVYKTGRSSLSYENDHRYFLNIPHTQTFICVCEVFDG